MLHSFKTSLNRPDRYSAKNMAKPINFFFLAPQARSVVLVGDFNSWDPNTHQMQRQPDGNWLGQVQLHHGHHHYLFLVDGERTLDPRARGIARNEKNERVSLISVS